MLWFKHDLRVHDLPGLDLAKDLANGDDDNIVPVYIFDPALAARSSPSMMRFTLESVAALRESLRELGSDLVVRTGTPSDVLPELAQSLECSVVVAEQELQSAWRSTATDTSAALQQVGIEVKEWSIELRPWEDTPPQCIQPLLDPNAVTLRGVKEFRAPPKPEFDYTSKLGQFVYMGEAHPAECPQPLTPPAALPELGGGVEVGSLPTDQEVMEVPGQADKLERVSKSDEQARLERQLDLAEEAAVASRSVRNLQVQVAANNELARWRKIVEDGDTTALPPPYRVPGGEKAVRDAYMAFLQFHMPQPPPEYRLLNDRIREVSNGREGTVGTAFDTLFEAAMLTGCISWRSVLAEAIAFESDPAMAKHGVWYYDGPINTKTGYRMYRVFGFPTVMAVVGAAERYDFLNSRSRKKLDLPSNL
ncbi:hypothetical protein CYMTET_44503 [Cymbomonas tetramitiformis]|uniref:Photolyase/cryptochrome alpha/beta domain-containing protein n=1 Tax=Cymbomonas tetramitiformis TaxID=36881 RepID=A0AAE0EZI1_9CHLO|nr:hypothetical protein CYMTET_44503 [Cymbomonas tetramitiformis]